MLLSEDGQQFDSISAGCLEADMKLRAESVYQTKKPEILQYDTASEDDLAWGTGSGCNGKITILLEPVIWQQVPDSFTEPLWPLLEKLLEQRKSFYVAKGISEIRLGKTMIYTEDGESFGSVGDSLLDEQVRQACSHPNRKQGSFHNPALQQQVYMERIQPKERLYVFGAGDDVEPVVKLASRLNFEITLIDPRESRCNAAYFPDADRYWIEHVEEAFSHLQMASSDYVLIMTHNFFRDQEIIRQLSKFNPHYVGILGSKRRTDKLFDQGEWPENIYSPIGLPIGADGPEEISTSIMAELIAVRRGMNRLNGKQQAARVLEKSSTTLDMGDE